MEQKEEIVVPYRITADVVKLDPYITADVINEIINCLEQIKERLDGR